MIRRKRTIKSKLFTYFFVLFTIFTVSILVFQDNREKHFRIVQLETRLNDYSDLVNSYIIYNNLQSTLAYSKLDSLKKLIPSDEIRITVLNQEGNVLYDNTVADYSKMENHLDRPEVQKAKYSHQGYNIRHSATTNHEYFYFAKYYNNLIVRTAVIYNTEIKNYLKIERAFIVYLLLLFVVFGFLLWLIAHRLGDSVSRLKEFTMKVSRDEELTPDMKFSDDELGSISREISRAYDQSRKVKAELLLEKEKLISHLFELKEGVGFFSPKKR